MKEIKPDNKWENDQIDDFASPDESGGSEYNVSESIAETSASSAIALMRIYDVLMCLYAEENPQDARKLAREHAAGKIRGTLPFLNLDE